MDKEIIKNILMKAGIDIIYETEDCFEINNSRYGRDPISFDFDKDGNLKGLTCYYY